MSVVYNADGSMSPDHITVWPREFWDNPMNQLEVARQRFRATIIGADNPLADKIPPGYKLTAAAKQRMIDMRSAVNRENRRALIAQWRAEDKKKPFVTFERI